MLAPGASVKSRQKLENVTVPIFCSSLDTLLEYLCWMYNPIIEREDRELPIKVYDDPLTLNMGSWLHAERELTMLGGDWN
jgi:hypothetical protein